ncbi:hypothetical protein [Ruegeria meonggei]|uniref:Uncharacterized protein n=1 Tax=Ruegeria meonggei TaxID=1446476 RepID=A0A1X6Z0N3_9RHOB|nr:hypothetical protein [Ruegeria meonggei]SLN36513.1 hypothetical protein RUM8411_01568 [Ruegeria meonggei]
MTQQQSAMRFAGGVLAATGILFALAALPALHPAAHVFLQVAYWPLHDVPPELAVPTPLLLGISGGLTVGLGAMQWALGTYVASISADSAAKVARCTAWTWFVTDSTASVLVGAPMNVVLNLSFLALILLSCKPRPEARLVSA